MKETPILFSGPMVRAILDGTKTQTRRVVKLPRWAHPDDKGDDLEGTDPMMCHVKTGCLVSVPCPYGKPGDRLWVREAWHLWGPPERQYVDYRATCPDADQLSWKPSIHMPRAYSRINLEVTAVRVERVQDISEADIKAEGIALPDCSYMGRCNSTRCPRHRVDAYRYAFAELWDKINGARGYTWLHNPWVWVVEFKRI